MARIQLTRHSNTILELITEQGKAERYEVRRIGDPTGIMFYDIHSALSYHDSMRPVNMRMPSRIGFIKEIRAFMTKEIGTTCDLRTAKEMADAAWPIVKKMVERANNV